MKTIDEQEFYVETNSDGKFIGRVAAFPKLRTRPLASRVTAIDQIISLTARRLREIDDSRAAAAESARQAK